MAACNGTCREKSIPPPSSASWFLSDAKLLLLKLFSASPADFASKKSIFCVQRSKFTDRSVWSIWLFQSFFDVQPKTWDDDPNVTHIFQTGSETANFKAIEHMNLIYPRNVTRFASSNQWCFFLCSFVGFFWFNAKKHHILGGGFKYFLFSPLPGEMIQFD